MKAHYATERAWLDAFNFEQQQARIATPMPIVERKYISGVELTRAPVQRHDTAPRLLRRFGRRA